MESYEELKSFKQHERKIIKFQFKAGKIYIFKRVYAEIALQAVEFNCN